MTNKELYYKFIKYKKNNKKITYQYLADKLNTSVSNISSRISSLKKDKPVTTKFLIDIENAIEKPIFFGK